MSIPCSLRSVWLISPAVRLADGGSPSAGRVEVLVQGVWGRVDKTNWGINAAHVVCRMLNFSAAISALSYGEFGQGVGPVWLRHVRCRGNETSLDECTHDGLGNVPLFPWQDAGAGVICEVPGKKNAASQHNLGRSGSISRHCQHDKFRAVFIAQLHSVKGKMSRVSTYLQVT